MDKNYSELYFSLINELLTKRDSKEPLFYAYLFNMINVMLNNWE